MLPSTIKGEMIYKPLTDTLGFHNHTLFLLLNRSEKTVNLPKRTRCIRQIVDDRWNELP